MHLRVLATLIFLVGCASVPPLTEGGKKVRIVKTSPHNCRYISQVEGRPGPGIVNDLPSGGAEDILMNAIKNEAARVGGNTVEVTTSSRMRLVGEAYSCEYNNSNP